VTSLAGLVMVLSAGDTVVLKETARVSGRFVRLVDLMDADHSGDAARAQAVEVYLGRSPEEGQTRVVTVDEIRREMERRGMDPGVFTFVGKQVEITRGWAPEVEGLRRAIEFEIKRLLDQSPEGRADNRVVRILSLNPETLPPHCQVAEVQPRGALEFTAVLVDPAKKRIEVQVVAGILRLREAAFAAHEILPGKILERGDLESRRVESSDDKAAPVELTMLVGATTAVRIRKGATIGPADLKLKAVVRKGDVVRAVSSTYEVDARALEDGAPGQEIGLEFVTSKNRFRAKVAGATSVEVVEGGK
jgi:flagella basal body P-ring formation protein FlgA